MTRLRLANLVNQLNKCGSINSYAFAFIQTEMNFRGSLFRICEILYAAWIIYIQHREPHLTLGKCQVSFPYWRKRFGQNNFALFLAVLDDVENYNVCCDYLNANKKPTLKETLICYNGRPSALYVRLFYIHLEQFNLTIRSLIGPRSIN